MDGSIRPFRQIAQLLSPVNIHVVTAFLGGMVQRWKRSTKGRGMCMRKGEEVGREGGVCVCVCVCEGWKARTGTVRVL